MQAHTALILPKLAPAFGIVESLQLLPSSKRSTLNICSDLASIFIVRDVVYPARWSLEIEDVIEADLHDLPADMSPRARRWIEAAISFVPGENEPAAPSRR